MTRQRKRKSKPKGKPRGTAPPPKDDALGALRGKIDSVDEQIQRLIAQRAVLAKEVGVLKGLTHTVEYYRPEREAQVLRKVVDRNDGPLRDEEMVRLFRELMSACLAQEEPLKVAYLGPEGTFTQTAVFKHFGHSVHALAVPTIDEVFHEVESGAADFGVAPIENSSEGTVNIHTLDMFLSSPLKMSGEIELRIHQHLMGRMADIKDVKRVCSHPQSLAQCRGWLAQHLPDAEKVPVVSNAEAARRARDEDGTAALAGEAAAKVYNLRILFNTVRGPRRQHDAVRRRRAQAVPRERQGQDVGARLGGRDGAPRRAASLAGAALEARHQHDAHRVAAVAQAQVGLRVLPRSRRPCRGRTRPQGPRGDEGPGVVVQNPGLVPESHPLIQAVPKHPNHFRAAPVNRVGGRIKVPGDKSISHRALMLGAIAEGTTTVRGFLASEDCLATQGALEAMGVAIERREDGVVRIEGVGPHGLRAPQKMLDLGNSGTAIRLLMGLLAGQIVRQHADGRCLAAAAADGARRRAAAPDGRADRDLGRRAAAGRRRGRREAARHRLPVADGERAGEVGAVAGGALRDRHDDAAPPGPSRDHTERMLGAWACGSPAQPTARGTLFR